MMYETGEVESLKEMLDKFLVFAQKYNETTVSWQLIDDRSDSFFGSTLKIPLAPYTYNGYNDKKVWIVDSSDFFDNFVEIGEKIYKPKVSNIFQKIFTGSVVEDVVLYSLDFNKEMANYYPYKYRITTSESDLLNYLMGVHELPDVIFFGGLSFSHDYTNLRKFCVENNIELRLFYFGRDKDKLDMAKSFKFDAYMDSNFFEDEFDISSVVNYDSLHDNFGSLKLNEVYTTEGVQQPSYPKERHVDIEPFSRFMKKLDIIMNVMLKTYRPCYYASFQYRRITGSSYSEFFNTKHNVMSEEINKIQGVGKRSFTGKGGIQAFNDTGEMIATGLHMSYDRDLWMCEQGNITCQSEADDGTNHMNLLPFWDFRGGSPYQRMDIPEYPGTGCPWLTIADRNKSEYGIGKDNKIKYYFSKSNRSATIVFRIKDKSKIYKDCWQTLTFGCFKYDTHSTLPPLYVAGGNQALVPDVWVYYPQEKHVNGLRYMLDMKNPCMSNSNLAYPTDFGGAHMSNFRVLCYDGKWRDVFSQSQTYTEYQYYDPCRTIYQWGVPVNYPTPLVNEHQSHLHKPKLYMGEMYRSNRPKYNLKDRHLLKNNIEVSVKFSEGRDERNIHGTIENCYIVPDFDKESGEVIYGNDKYVLVPNGWDERLWHYKWYTGRIYWGGKNAQGESGLVQKTGVANEQAYQDYHLLENHHEVNKNKINTKLLIKTGEIDKVRDFDLEIEDKISINNSSTNARRLIMEMYVGATNYGIVELQFYVDGRTVLVDWGDGTEPESYNGWEDLNGEFRYYSDKIGYYKYRNRMRHRYKEIGFYTIKIYAENNDSYEQRFIFFSDVNNTYGGFIQGFEEIDYEKILPVYNTDGTPTGNKKLVSSKIRRMGINIDNNAELYVPRFFQTKEESQKDENGNDVSVRVPLYTDGIQKEYKTTTAIVFLMGFRINNRFGDIFKNPPQTWTNIMWYITRENKDGDFFLTENISLNKSLLKKENYRNLILHNKCVVEDRGTWIHFPLVSYDNIYFVGNRKSAYVDIMESFFPLKIHLCKSVTHLYLNNIPSLKTKDNGGKIEPDPELNQVSVYVYSSTDFHVTDISMEAKRVIFYCKKELIDKFSNSNPGLTFKELIV